MFTLFYFVKFLFELGLFFYSVMVISGYLILAVISFREIHYYLKKNSFTDYSSILKLPIAPSVSLLAPAYNEGMTIVDNVRSLLSLHYANFEVVVINDGSTDDSLAKLIEHYDLEPVDFFVDYKIPTKEVRHVYRSANPAFYKLTVVDKVNGGKSDALNVGMNIARHELFAAIDVDCIIEEDAILKMVKPFIEEADTRVIATGGVVRIANSCTINLGRITEVNLPKNLWARFQVLEYIRAFLLGRMAWANLDGLLLISGAFGIFDKQVAILAGGYYTKTVGEDMELVVRMRRYMHDHNLKYKVAFIPDPLCWTEAPSSLKLLNRQRSRWTRGTIETLWRHKRMFFNSNYGVLGMLSFPYWFFFEWLAPITEFFGIIYFIAAIYLGQVYWTYCIALSLTIYFFALFYSSIAIFSEDISFCQYNKPRDLFKLILIAILEPLIFHPMTVVWAIKGNIEKLRGRHTWGAMTRTGFSTTAKKS